MTRHACAQGRAALALGLLTAVAEEGSALERKRHTAVMPILVRRSAEVLSLVSTALSGKPGELQFSARLLAHGVQAHCCSRAMRTGGLPMLCMQRCRVWRWQR